MRIEKDCIRSYVDFKQENDNKFKVLTLDTIIASNVNCRKDKRKIFEEECFKFHY